jgi:hypothetical protein
MNRATMAVRGAPRVLEALSFQHTRELGPLELIHFDEIEPVSSPRRSARCRSRAISKSGERYPRETKSRHAVKRDG